MGLFKLYILLEAKELSTHLELKFERTGSFYKKPVSCAVFLLLVTRERHFGPSDVIYAHAQYTHDVIIRRHFLLKLRMCRKRKINVVCAPHFKRMYNMAALN